MSLIAAPDPQNVRSAIHAACANLERYFEKAGDDQSEANHLVHEITALLFKNRLDEEGASRYRELLSKLRVAHGAGRDTAEQNVLSYLSQSIMELFRSERAPSSATKVHRPLLAVVYKIAEDSIAFTRPRDQFSTKRKALAVELLDALSGYYDMPNLGGLLNQALSANRVGAPLRMAVCNLWYHLERDDIGLDPKLIKKHDIRPIKPR